MSKQNERPTISLATKHFAEGATRPVTAPIDAAGETIMVQCTDGAFQSMWHHARRGLPKGEEGGTISGDMAIEVKGYLLGIVEMRGDVKVVTIKDVVQLPFNQQDAGDAAYFNAKDRAILEAKLRAKPGLQMVGNYHSHPNHDVKLSDQDVVYLSQYLTEPFQVAAIVGPRVPAVGFFLKNAVGEYVPWQEPDSLVDFRENGLPDITEEKDASGNVIINVGRKVNWRLLGIVAALLAVGIFVVARMTAPPPRAVLKASADDVVIHATDEDAQAVALFIDGDEGRLRFVVDEETVPSWLRVEPMGGELAAAGPLDLLFNVDFMSPELALGDTVNQQVTVLGYLSDDMTQEPDRVNIMVSAIADMRTVTINETWPLPPIRVRDGQYVVDLSDGPDDADITVRGLVFKGDSWQQVFRRKNPGSGLRLPRETFGSPLAWNSIKIEVLGIRLDRAADRVRRYEIKGSKVLQKQHLSWDLDNPEPVEDELKVTTRPLPYPAWYRIQLATSTGRFIDFATGTLDAGQQQVFMIPFTNELSSIDVYAAYVGQDRVYELKYLGVVAEVVDEQVIAFDASQGAVGKAFRKNRPDVYKAANLQAFGEMQGPRHLEDIAQVNRWGRLKLLSNKQVHDSWRDLVRIGQEALTRNDGQMAWLYDEKKQVIHLVFVMPEGEDEYRSRLEWLFQHDEIRALFKDQIEQRRRLELETGPLEAPETRGWRVN